MERENMVQDLSMLQEFYEAYAAKIGRIREKLARPLTYAEKILYTHLYDDADLRSFKRGEDYVNFPIVWPCRMQRRRWLSCNS